jgi:hypothetical protein
MMRNAPGSRRAVEWQSQDELLRNASHRTLRHAFKPEAAIVNRVTDDDTPARSDAPQLL